MNPPLDSNNQFGNVGDPVVASPDQDGDTGRVADVLTYTLGGPDSSLFTIDTVADTTTDPDKVIGQIRVGGDTVLDFETKDTYTVDVIATDPSGASDTITVTIKIVDVDEEPEFSKRGLSVSGDRAVSYPENGTADVATYTASGADASGATWSLEGEDVDDFRVSPTGGVLTFRTLPNFEAPTDANTDNTYSVTVKASKGNISDTRTVTVTVTNEDEGGTVTISSPGNEVKVGVQLTAALDEGDEEVVTGWQWASGASATGDFTNISGETNNTYTPVEADVGNFLRITVNYTDATFGVDSLDAVTASAVVAASTAGTPGTLALDPTTQLTSGDRITATLTDADNPTNQAWQWARSSTASGTFTNIPNATSASYTATDDDAGNYLRATVTYTDDSSGTGQTAGRLSRRPVRVKLHTYDADADGRIDRR